MPTVVRDVVVSNEHGLHARPAMQLVDTANTFDSTITIHRDADNENPAVDADAKSVMAVITLAATQGTTLHIKAEGEDAEQAVEALVELFDSKFGEKA